MSLRRTSPVLLALLSLLSATACYNLNKVDPGPRWIDDFTSSTPTWSVFSPWGCGAELQQPTKPDGGVADGGRTDAGRTDAETDAAVDTAVPPLPACPLVSGTGDMNARDPNDKTNLAFSFEIPEDMGIQDAIVHTAVPSAGPVDFTGFQQFVFSLRLSSKNPSPAGTGLSVLLGCSRNGTDNLATQAVPTTMYTIDSTAWWHVHLDLSLFYVSTSLSQACLSEIDSISFLVSPGTTDLPTFSGTLSLDNISLQND